MEIHVEIRTRRRSHVWLILSIVALSSVAYGFAAAHLNKYHSVWSCDSGARVAMVRNWAEHGSLIHLDYAQHSADPTAELHPLGMAAELDASGHPHLRINPIEIEPANRPFPNERASHGYLVETPKGIVTVCSPLFPFVSGIFYRFMGFDGLVVFPLLGGLAAIAASYCTAARLGMRSAPILALGLAFATPLALYSTVYWDHSVHMGITALAGWLMLRTLQEKSFRYGLAAGGILGLGVWFHELFIFLTAAILLAALPLLKRAEWRRISLSILCGFAAIAGAWIIGNLLIYGAPGGTHALMPPELARGLQRQMFSRTNFLARFFSQLVGSPSLTVGGLQMLVLLAAYSISTLVGGKARLVGYGLLLAVGYSFFNQVRGAGWAAGLFQATPLLIPALAAPYAISDQADETCERQFIRWISRASFLFMAIVLINPIDPALNWGSRYLLTALPFFALLAAHRLEADFEQLKGPAKWAPAFCAVFLVIVSMVSQVHGFHAIEEDLQYSRELSVAARSAGTSAIVTDIYWLGAELAPAAQIPPVLLVRDSTYARFTLIAALNKMGAAQFTYFGDDAGFREILTAVTGSSRGYSPGATEHKCGRLFVRFSRQPQATASLRQRHDPSVSRINQI